MKVLFYARKIKKVDEESTLILFESALKKKFTIFSSSEVYSFLARNNLGEKTKEVENYESLRESSVEMVLTLGGDGTILGATTLIRDLSIPVLGINFGRLGFLANVEKKFMDQCLNLIMASQYVIEERSMLTLVSHPPLFGKLNFALNDFTIHKRDTSAMITIHTYINGDYLNSYWADGLIISTPTGSTGYSLSCGGPIVFPNSGNFIITPVAPHNLNVRPLVISDSSVISFEVEGRTENFLCTLDSRVETITATHQLAVRKSDFPTKLVTIKDITFLKTLHEKLSWGADSRN